MSSILVNHMEASGTQVMCIVNVHLLLSSASVKCHGILFIPNFKGIFLIQDHSVLTPPLNKDKDPNKEVIKIGCKRHRSFIKSF